MEPAVHRSCCHTLRALVGAAARDGTDAAVPWSGPTSCCDALAPADCCAEQLDIVIDFAERRGPPPRGLSRIRVPLRHPPSNSSRPSPHERAVDWCKLAALVVPIRGLARRRVQRVRLQLLEVALAGTHAARRGRSSGPQSWRRPTCSRQLGELNRTYAIGELRRPTPLPPPRCRPRRHSARSTADDFVCTLHGWRFDLEIRHLQQPPQPTTRLRIRPATASD